MNLPEDLLNRSFVAPNGERAFSLEDIEAVLAACEAARIPVSGWEVWIIDHNLSPSSELKLVPAPGRWCGLIPTPGGGSAVIGGFPKQEANEADERFLRRALAETRNQVRSFRDGSWVEVAKDWLPYVRINLTIWD